MLLYGFKNHQIHPVIFVTEKKTGRTITRMQASRIVSEVAKAVKIPLKVSPHSLRKTFGYHAWKNGTSPALIIEIYNHSSYTVTKTGISQDDKNTVYKEMDYG